MGTDPRHDSVLGAPERVDPRIGGTLCGEFSQVLFRCGQVLHPNAHGATIPQGGHAQFHRRGGIPGYGEATAHAGCVRDGVAVGNQDRSRGVLEDAESGWHDQSDECGTLFQPQGTAEDRSECDIGVTSEE